MLGDSDDDVTLRGRRVDDRRGADLHEAPADREVTLNTGTVLALFFTLALVCAVFFGFGYSMGRKSGQSAAVSNDSSSTATAADTTAPNPSSFKPTPGSPVVQPVPGYQSSEANDTPSKATAPAPVKATPVAPAQAPGTVDPASTVTRKPVVNPDAAIVGSPKPAPVVRTPPAAAPPVTTYNSAAPTTGMTYVQIAAVSHPEDADVLLSALQRRGYKVIARNDTNDKLIHVQIGPFTDRKQAEATRQKLIGDGYNAFLK
ncbi:SPOR domain-containing protein [Terriglobus roseus]|uniref:Sporulation related domain-containing protein n=1 Tax=Terriglobus roseus TaxID=392734 RepID=A0A1H4QE31_9BACT|nr:SPOR domain-containing protein [Terriglobus roseus]SEC17857.1 Sporulation related domain-containing protein [Terriglobus roseus]